jgi:hypothetical protein
MKFVRCALMAILLTAAGCGSPGKPEAEKLAAESAGEWLELVDSGHYIGGDARGLGASRRGRSETPRRRGISKNEIQDVRDLASGGS